jgi:hypothetical protein
MEEERKERHSDRFILLVSPMTKVCLQSSNGHHKKKIDPGSALLLRALASPLPSAQAGLTAVFGMGTGVSPPLLSHLESFDPSKVNRVRHANDGAIRTARLSRLLCVHLRPINLVFSQGSQRPHLGVGFALRCLQRLSRPDLATQRCSWRNSWYTSGPALPVLSY